MHIRRIVLIVFSACVLAGLVGIALIYTFDEYKRGDFLVRYGFGFANLIGIIILLAHTDLYRSWKVFLIAPGVMAGLAGILFKIMHWPGANELLLSGGILTAVGYTVRFFLKRPIKLQDVLRWAWVLSYCAVMIMVIFHYISSGWTWLPRVILIVTMVEFLLSERSFRDN